jgi:CheY-like chemotaxis protein
MSVTSRQDAQRGAALHDPIAPGRGGHPMTDSPTILLVEDDPDTRRYITTCLQSEGYLVQVARNGREALTILEHELPSAMIVDLMMPVMDGAELRRRQQQLPEAAGVPFILVSGTHELARRIALDLGIEDVVPKPCDTDRLLDIVASRCHQHH